MYTTKNYKEPGGRRWVIEGELALVGDGRITKDGEEVFFGVGLPSDRTAGQSAYEIAVKHGFEGTEEEWLTSLIGSTGEAGVQGEKGETGAKGSAGAKGDPGFPTKEEWDKLVARVEELEGANGKSKAEQT
ncbi:collagen-like protein [Paenibacillus alvei]|uniref:collagen-like triple helix repeat-containing protein n=1 Tax=Paenibacillus alvei TaxID=44250 RepID=UPI000289D40F|nr:collagen-like protein [Paenibacillus alvei]EJW20030.1 collagen triple helix repeat protein [Paenibacillus alvei DSM 29]MCY9543383.1 collagen-like protein [Paenibacillus alvei]MCY9704737.1 collagen-like protein [Paenibacillus alvei]MCY9733710.1 collagen-like protein [Paenibacillus alvei]MCY9755499.1 collagen-like protein [Paenibacillus alvei]